MTERSEREVLHDLIEICKDGERGFRTAADFVGDPDLKALFAELARQRHEFADELVPHLQRLGGLPDGGSRTATIHRGWMKLKGLMPGVHDHAIVTEAERGENAALDAYNEALEGMLPPTVSGLVESQREELYKATDRIRAIDMGYR